MHRTECSELSSWQSSSVGLVDESEVYTRSKEQPLAARLRDMAAPIPGK